MPLSRRGQRLKLLLHRGSPARHRPEKAEDEDWNGTHVAPPATTHRCRKPAVGPRARPARSNADATLRLPGFLGARRLATFYPPGASFREYVILPICPSQQGSTPARVSLQPSMEARNMGVEFSEIHFRRDVDSRQRVRREVRSEPAAEVQKSRGVASFLG